MLRWTALDLAAASKVGVATIRKVEVVDGEIPVPLMRQRSGVPSNQLESISSTKMGKAKASDFGSLDE